MSTLPRALDPSKIPSAPLHLTRSHSHTLSTTSETTSKSSSSIHSDRGAEWAESDEKNRKKRKWSVPYEKKRTSFSSSSFTDYTVGSPYSISSSSFSHVSSVHSSVASSPHSSPPLSPLSIPSFPNSPTSPVDAHKYYASVNNSTSSPLFNYHSSTSSSSYSSQYQPSTGAPSPFLPHCPTFHFLSYNQAPPPPPPSHLNVSSMNQATSHTTQCNSNTNHPLSNTDNIFINNIPTSPLSKSNPSTPRHRRASRSSHSSATAGSPRMLSSLPPPPPSPTNTTSASPRLSPFPSNLNRTPTLASIAHPHQLPSHPVPPYSLSSTQSILTKSPVLPCLSDSVSLPVTSVMPTFALAPTDPATDHHFNYSIGDILINRYEVKRLLGRGTFSQVLECRDLAETEQHELMSSSNGKHCTRSDIDMGKTKMAVEMREERVAIKVVRAVDRYRAAAEKESKILTHLSLNRAATEQMMANNEDSSNSSISSAAASIIPFLGTFCLSNHICLVFPVCGLSLYDFLRLNRFRPFFPGQVKQIAYQLCSTVAYLHDEMNVIHADIKPENILFADSTYTTIQLSDLPFNIPLSTTIRLIDFGTAVYNSNNDKPSVVVSRSYRPLEVVLSRSWSYGVDIWALGCVLVELCTGHRLFNITTSADKDHLGLMEEILGNIPMRLMENSKIDLGDIYRSSDKSSSMSEISYMNSKEDQNINSKQMKSVDNCITTSKTENKSKLRTKINTSDYQFIDLIEKMLIYDPAERITARQALQHPYFDSN